MRRLRQCPYFHITAAFLAGRIQKPVASAANLQPFFIDRIRCPLCLRHHLTRARHLRQHICLIRQVAEETLATMIHYASATSKALTEFFGSFAVKL